MMVTVQGWSGSLVNHPEIVLQLRALEAARNAGDWVGPASDDLVLAVRRAVIADVRGGRSVRDSLIEAEYWFSEAARFVFVNPDDGDARFWCVAELDQCVYVLWARGLVARRYMVRFADILRAVCGFRPLYALWPAGMGGPA